MEVWMPSYLVGSLSSYLGKDLVNQNEKNDKGYTTHGAWGVGFTSGTNYT